MLITLNEGQKFKRFLIFFFMFRCQPALDMRYNAKRTKSELTIILEGLKRQYNWPGVG